MATETRDPYEQYPVGEDYVIGVDPARYGPDLTAVCVAQGDLVREFITWGRIDLMASVARLQTEARHRGINYYEEGCRRGWHPGRFIVDEPGLGGGVVDKLKLLGYQVEPFNGARTLTDDEWKNRQRVKNVRAAAYWSLRVLLEEDKIAIPRNPRLWDELLSTRWDTDPTSERIYIYPKDEIRSLLGRSPDLADSLSLVAYWMGRRRMTIGSFFVTF